MPNTRVVNELNLRIIDAILARYTEQLAEFGVEYIRKHVRYPTTTIDNTDFSSTYILFVRSICGARSSLIFCLQATPSTQATSSQLKESEQLSQSCPMNQFGTLALEPTGREHELGTSNYESFHWETGISMEGE